MCVIESVHFMKDSGILSVLFIVKNFRRRLLVKTQDLV